MLVRHDDLVESSFNKITLFFLFAARAGRDWISVWWGGDDTAVEPGNGGSGGGGLVRGYWLGWGLGVPDSHSRELPSHAHSHVIRALG